MATDADLERIALALPGVELGTFWGGPAYVVAGKAIANRREPRRDVGAVDPLILLDAFVIQARRERKGVRRIEVDHADAF